MKFNIVDKAFFFELPDGSSRLDPEFASPAITALETQLSDSLDCDLLSTLSAPYNGPTVNAKLKKEGDLAKYVAIDSIDVSDGLTYSETIRFGDRPSRAQYVLKSGDILVSTVRPNRGALALISERLDGALASSAFAIVRLAEQKQLTKEFVFAFLRSRYARLQLIRRNRGSMFPAVLESDVGGILIPTPPGSLRTSVQSLVTKGVGYHDKFFQLVEEQTGLLNSFLNSVGEPPPDPLSPNADGSLSVAVRSYEDFFSQGGALRFDAEFFRKEYDKFSIALSKYKKVFPVSAFYTACTGRAQGSPADEILYIKQAALTNAGINWSAANIEPGSRSPARGRVKTEDILLACTAHEIYYVGRKVDYVRQVPKEYATNNVCVSDLIILSPKSTKPAGLDGAYVAAFLRSPWGLHQVQRTIRGLRGGHVYPRDILDFVKVPMPDDSWLAHFSRLAFEAESARMHGKEAIQTAVKETEQWIESSLGGAALEIGDMAA